MSGEALQIARDGLLSDRGQSAPFAPNGGSSSDPSTSRGAHQTGDRSPAGAGAWLVGGAVRDRELGRSLSDIDVVVEGDAGQAARAIAAAARERGVRVACFALSEEFGAWRVATAAGGWQIDVESLRGGSLPADLALRDFTVNAIAEPIAGGDPIDPLGGLTDLAAGRLRRAGERAFVDDPLRVLRLVRVAVELGLEPDAPTLAAAREQADRLSEVSPERVFAELRRILACAEAVRGVELMGEVGAAAAVLPELDAMRGVEQSRYHHRDVYGHTLEVLERTVALTSGDPAAVVGERHAAAVAALLAEPLADGLTRGEALRWGALLHDAAKPATRAVRPLDRRVTFMGHDVQGAELARELLVRLRASVRLREHVAALVRWHLRLGFLVHEPQPLAREQVFAYLRDCEPVEVDVTLLSVCDRLATRGARSQAAIDAHLALARTMLDDALSWREQGPPQPLLRGDELAAALGIELGPRVGQLLEELARAQYAGRVRTREQALELAAERLSE
ncbi:MAG TPA: HD domain-containing protein [Solirubrobacteraceae bacterium]|nr:HD domain-containing protein [Solirubrobacteraceae bacterium]